MIVTVEQMKMIENESLKTSFELASTVAQVLLEKLLQETSCDDRILVLCGKGNNGADGALLASLLKQHRHCKVVYVDGTPTSPLAKQAYLQLDSKDLVEPNHLRIEDYSIIVDGVYGFSYHGNLNDSIKELFDKINLRNIPVYSIDINSGAEADTGHVDKHAIKSKVTYAIDCHKIFHMLKKHHQLFDRVELLDLKIPHQITPTIHTMDEELFFKHFPKKAIDAHKGSYGKTLLCGGCVGMAGAVCLNVLGSLAIGSDYLQVAITEAIYPILANHFMTPVYYPFTYNTYTQILLPLIQNASSIGYGSGAVHLLEDQGILDLILQNATCPVVLDAHALRLLTHNTYLLGFAKSEIILTPHVKEFADLANVTVEEVLDHPVELVSSFVEKNHVNVVLKGPNTIVCFKDQDLYINQSGNQALSTAGSGDVLTGIITSLLTIVKDVKLAVMMGVYIHGHLADLTIQDHAIQNFTFDHYHHYMEQLYRKHGL